MTIEIKKEIVLEDGTKAVQVDTFCLNERGEKAYLEDKEYLFEVLYLPEIYLYGKFIKTEIIEEE